MNHRVSTLAWMLLGIAGATPLGAGVLDCVSASPIDVVLRIDPGEPPRRLKLIGGISPAMTLVDPGTQLVLWSAGATAPATQIFPSMWAGFSASLIALDLDADGTHDRIYAGDLAGRLWRFDIHQGAGPARLFTGGVFAELGGGPPATRAFVAAPDVSLGGSAEAPWLNVAIGSASISLDADNNRFYVLRDHAAFESWSQQQYLDWDPLTESDLLWMNDPAGAQGPDADDTRAPGFYVTLAQGSVLASSITVAGRAVIAVATEIAGADGQCRAAVTISSLSLQTARNTGHEAGRTGLEAGLVLPGRIATSALFEVQPANGADPGRCSFGDVAIADCTVSTTLHPLWWRREDAD